VVQVRGAAGGGSLIGSAALRASAERTADPCVPQGKRRRAILIAFARGSGWYAAVHAEHRDTNRRNWNERALIHARSRMYDLDGFVADPGKIWLHPAEPLELGSVAGKTLCHLQCHLGVETLSWLRLGARRVVGLDFAPAAVAAARELAERTGLSERASFVEADVYDALEALDGQHPFDVVYVSLGAICWLPDIRRWARLIASLLAPGSLLFVREVHPVLQTLLEQDGRLWVTYPYFERVEPLRFDDGTTYTEGRPELVNKSSYEWNHGIAEMLSALLEVGFTIELFHEHREAEFQAFPSMSQGADGYYRLPEPERERVPLVFSLRARR
jgi:SAM-dependent methyltransferase